MTGWLPEVSDGLFLKRYQWTVGGSEWLSTEGSLDAAVVLPWRATLPVVDDISSSNSPFHHVSTEIICSSEVVKSDNIIYLQTSKYRHWTRAPNTVTQHSHRTQLSNTVIEHSYRTQLPNTVTKHNHRTQLLNTVIEHNHRMQSPSTITQSSNTGASQLA